MVVWAARVVVPTPQAQSRFLLGGDDGAVGLRIVFFLHLCTCKHLDSSLLDLLELTGALVLDVAGPRVDGYLGHGALPRLDRPHDLVPSVVLISDLLAHVSITNLDLAFCTVLAFSTVWSFSASSTFTWVLVAARAVVASNSSSLVARVLAAMSSSSLLVRVSAATNSSVQVP